MKKAASCDVGDLVRLKMLDGVLYMGRLVYMDADWVDIALRDEPGNRQRMIAPVDEVESIELVAT